MGRLGQNPSSRGYATPTYATTPLTARETFGGNSKAGLGRHIGMGPFTYSAIVNGSSGHQASFLAGNSFPAAFKAGRLLDIKYPISDTNQLARIGTGTTGGMTRTPADGVNLKEREEMQTRVDKWNKVWPSMPQRDTPNGCCKSIPHLNQDDDHTNITANETLYGNSGPFGEKPPSKGIPTWSALAGAYVPALDPEALPNGRKWQAATNANTEVNKFVSNFTSDTTITIGPVQGKNYGGTLVNTAGVNARYTSRQLFLWDDPSEPLYISYNMNLNDIYCNNSAVFFCIFPNSTCRTSATKNYCDAFATQPTLGRCQELDLMETDGKYYFGSTWHPLTTCTDGNSDTWYSTYSLFSGRAEQPQNFIANILGDRSDWDSSFYLPVKHRFTQNSKGHAIWEVEFNNNGTWYKNYTNGNGASNPAVEKQLFESLGGGSDETTAAGNGAGFRLILGINSGRPLQLTNTGDTGSSKWDGGTIDGFTCDCKVSEGNTTDIDSASYNVGLQAWYLQDIELENVTTISTDLITQDNFDPYLAPNQTPGTDVGLLPHTP